MKLCLKAQIQLLKLKIVNKLMHIYFTKSLKIYIFMLLLSYYKSEIGNNKQIA